MILMIMRRLSNLFFILVLGLTSIFFSCKKKKDLVFNIEGEVFDSSLNQILQSGTMRLYKVPAATTQEILVEEQNIVNGKYAFTFDRDMSEKYVLRFSKTDYFEEDFEVYFSELQVGEIYTLNFSVEAVAIMHWVFIDQPPLNPNYSVSIQKLNGRTTGSGTCPNQEYSFSGGLNPDTLKCAVSGNRFVNFYIIELPNATLDSVYCNAFDSSYYTVNF